MEKTRVLQPRYLHFKAPPHTNLSYHGRHHRVIGITRCIPSVRPERILVSLWEKSRTIQWGRESRRYEYKYLGGGLLHVTHGTQLLLASVLTSTKQFSRCDTRYKQPFWVFPYAPALLTRCQKPLGWNSMPEPEAGSTSLLPSREGMSLKTLKIA
jgi:hypothetical protein